MTSRNAGGRPVRITDRLILALVQLWALVTYGRQMRRHWSRRKTLPRVALPRTFSEKFLWRKIFDRDPRFVVFADKIAMRDWMQSRAPELKLAKLRLVARTPKDIPDEALAGGVMVKANNGSGRNIRLPAPPADRAAFDAEVAAWAKPYGLDKAEWMYGEAEPRIMIEELVEPAADDNARDYAFFCCGGEPLLGLYTLNEKQPPTPIGFFELDGTRRDRDHLQPSLIGGREWMTPDTRVPPTWARAAAIARCLCPGFDFIRVDMMVLGDDLYAAEMTTIPGSGYSVITVPGIADDVNAAWDLRKSWFLSTPQTGWRGVYARALRRVLDATAGEAPLVY